MNELERDLKTAKKFASDVGHKSKNILGETLNCTKEYMKKATNRCYCGFKRVVKMTADVLRSDENNGED